MYYSLLRYHYSLLRSHYSLLRSHYSHWKNTIDFLALEKQGKMTDKFIFFVFPELISHFS